MNEEQALRRKEILVKGLSMGTFKQVRKKEPKDRALQLLEEGENRNPKKFLRLPIEYLTRI